MFVKQGGQYAVYFFGQRVLKVPHSLRRAELLFRLRWARELSKEEARKRAHESVENGRRSVAAAKELAEKYPEMYRYFCRPSFARKNYSQDRVKTFEQVIASQDHKANVRLLEAYADALLQEWRYGFFETEFDLLENSGLDKDSAVVLLDFGDITVDKAEVAQIISEKAWLADWSYTNGLPQDLRAPFASIMAKKLTPANLKRHWAAAL